MAIRIGLLWNIVQEVFPVISETVRAASKDSPGGKRITPEERDIIIASALARLGKILEDNLPR